MQIKALKITIIACWLSLLALSGLLQAQTPISSRDAVGSVRKFVRDFYSWYFPKALEFQDSADLALKDRAYVFSPELFKELKEDSDARARSPGHEIYVLGSDPFFDSQEPLERYELRRITKRGHKYFVEVVGVYPVRPFEGPGTTQEVIAEVERRSGHWVFTNFLFPSVDAQFGDTPNLLEYLRSLRKDREREKKDTQAK